MSLKSLRKAVKGKTNNDFVVGTVIRWVSGGRYTYAALKFSDTGWQTTANVNNPYVARTLTFDQLLQVLQRSEVSDVHVSTEWTPI